MSQWADSYPPLDYEPMGEGLCRKIVKRRSRAVDGELHCERCGFNSGMEHATGLSLHHRRKRSHLPRWRRWEPSNCVMLCGDGTRGCHGWVESHPEEARVEGFHVHSWEEPREVPVRLWHTTSLLYPTDEGGWQLDPPTTAEDNAGHGPGNG